MSLDKRKIQREIIDALREVPFINHTVKKIGVSRMTFYRWMQKDKSFSYNVHAALQEGHKNMIEIAESALFKKIRSDHFGAIKFYLENNHGNYMNRKYRVQAIPDRNYQDAPNPAHARIPNLLVLDEEQTEQFDELNRIAEANNYSREEVEMFTEMIRDGTFSQYLKELGRKYGP